jgi:Ca2+-binding EF-hand superfamily protein
MWSLFKLMTLDDWIVISEKVIHEKPGMRVFFIGFIFTTSMALISLVPAIFIEITLSSKSRADKLQEELKKDQTRRQKEKSLRTLFKVTDADSSGRVSLEELRTVLTDPSSMKKLRDAGLTQPRELEDVRLGLFDLFETRLEELRQQNTARLVPMESVQMSEEEFISSLLRTETDLSQMTIWRTTTATRLMLQELCSTLQLELEDIRKKSKGIVEGERNDQGLAHRSKRKKGNRV